MSTHRRRPSCAMTLLLGSLLLVGVLLLTGALALRARPSFVMASAIEGQVLAGPDGPFVSGARVTRTWSWGLFQTTGTDDAITDAQGWFRFPTVRRRSLLAAILPHEPSVRVRVLLHRTRDAPLEVLSMERSSYVAYAEFGGEPVSLRCRTDIEPDSRGFFWGTCEPDSWGER